MEQAFYDKLSEVFEKVSDDSEKQYVKISFFDRGEIRHLKFVSCVNQADFINEFIEQFGSLDFIEIVYVESLSESMKHLFDIDFG